MSGRGAGQSGWQGADTRPGAQPNGPASGFSFARVGGGAPAHAHLLLLGWASLALAGVIYHLYPAAATTLLARIHFWLHTLGLPAFMIALGMLLTGHESAGPAIAISASVVLLGLTIFAANVLVNVRPAA